MYNYIYKMSEITPPIDFDKGYIKTGSQLNINAVKPINYDPTFAILNMDEATTLNMGYVSIDNQSFKGIKTFNDIPRCKEIPIEDDDLTNKLYVDTSLPKIEVSKPLNYDVDTGQLTIDPASIEDIGYMSITDQTFKGVKTFDDLPKCVEVPIEDDDLTNKFYVDTLLPLLDVSKPLNYDDATGELTIDEATIEAIGYVSIGDQSFKGVKTFDDTPKCVEVPLEDDDIVNKLYVDTSLPKIEVSKPLNYDEETGELTIDEASVEDKGYVSIGDQSFTGVKTFIDTPKCDEEPIEDDDIVNKEYVDTALSGDLNVQNINVSNDIVGTNLKCYTITTNGEVISDEVEQVMPMTNGINPTYAVGINEDPQGMNFNIVDGWCDLRTTTPEQPTFLAYFITLVEPLSIKMKVKFYLEDAVYVVSNKNIPLLCLGGIGEGLVDN